MQQAQQRGMSERMSWARAIIFASGFFFLSAILLGQLPGYINLEMTLSTLEGFEQGMLGLAVVSLGGFVVIQVIVLLFDPKPVLPPSLFTGLGAILTVAGLALAAWATLTGCSPLQTSCNQYFPVAGTNTLPLLSGKFLWFQAGSIDFLMISLGLLGVGAAMIFYSILAMREQRDPDRRDLGTTPAIRWMLIGAISLLVVFLILYTYINDVGLAAMLFPDRPFFGLRLIQFVSAVILGVSIFFASGALLLRLHYLMRPVRKRTMSGLYLVGALGLAQLGAVFLLLWLFAYPLVAWIHTWSFLGLGDYLTICSRKTAVPASCSFTQQSGYIVNAIFTTNFFILLAGAIWAWKSNRNLVVIGSIVTTAMIAAATIVIHTSFDKLLIAMILSSSMIILAAVWTMVSRREFAVVGERNLGCLGMWLVVGTCLFIYLGAFALFSLPQFPPETEPNIPFVPGLLIPAPTVAGQAPTLPAGDALTMVVIMGILAAIQFFFLSRNRYKV
jgi:hypothetical protein